MFLSQSIINCTPPSSATLYGKRLRFAAQFCLQHPHPNALPGAPHAALACGGFELSSGRGFNHDAATANATGSQIRLRISRRRWGRWGREMGRWGQTGSFPYSENLQSLCAKRVVSNKYQKTFRLSPIPHPRRCLGTVRIGTAPTAALWVLSSLPTTVCGGAAFCVE